MKPGAVPAYLLDREQVRRTKAGGGVYESSFSGRVDVISCDNGGIVMLCPSAYARVLLGALKHDQAEKKGEGR